MLDKVSAPVQLNEVLELLQLHYGFTGQLQPITGERDYNFVLTQANGNRFIVKVAHEEEAFETLHFQSRMIACIQKNAPLVPVSVEIPNFDGEVFSCVKLAKGPLRFLRVNAFMPGIALSDVERSSATRKAVGELTGSLALALKGFNHPAAQRELLWDIQQAAALAPHIQSLPQAQRQIVAHFHSRYLTHVSPSIGKFRQGVIHNDLNLHNLFVDPNDHGRISGCIDFGDAVWAPVVNDLAIATAYQLDVQRPLQSILQVAQAYHRLHPLEPLDLDHLYDLVAMRFVLTVAITHWRSKLHPENALYILRNAQAAWNGLQALKDISSAAAREFLYDQLLMKAENAQ
jgi:hydroxylysine kinase